MTQQTASISRLAKRYASQAGMTQKAFRAALEQAVEQGIIKPAGTRNLGYGYTRTDSMMGGLSTGYTHYAVYREQDVQDWIEGCEIC